MDTNNLARTIVLSSVLTLFVVFGVLYITRAELAQFILSQAGVPSETSVTNIFSGDTGIVSAIEQVNPAVVSVIVTKDVPVYERYYESLNPFGLRGGLTVPRVRENGTEEREVGAGSGFIVSTDGLIVTNRHVTEDEAARYSVVLNDGTIYRVVVLARDPQLDIAILKIDEPLTKALPYVHFGDSKALRLGEPVIAIGNALAEFQNSVSVGVVSGLARSIVASDAMGKTEQLHEVIQTDAAINPGNSGGPLLNVHGEVIGVNVATSRGADNIGFALPADLVKSVVDSVREHGEIIRPLLGVRYAMITPQIAKANGLPVTYGALVVRGVSADEPAVLPGSPAASAGITENMIILSVDGKELRNVDLATVLREKTVGQSVELGVLQDGVETVVLLTLAKAL